MRKKAISIITGILLYTLLPGISITVCAAEPADASDSLEEGARDLGYDNGADTGYPYLQAAFNVPCLCVFGISHFGLYYLYSNIPCHSFQHSVKAAHNSFSFMDITIITHLNEIFKAFSLFTSSNKVCYIRSHLLSEFYYVRSY